jgi:hypothetical protein
MAYPNCWLRSAVPAALAAGFFVAATAVMTYPLVPRAWDTVPFRVDPLLLTWTLDWELHQLLSQPLALFDANIFWPYHGTLAYSDLALPDLLVFGPVELLTGNPILAFNCTLFAMIAASGWTAYLLARRLVRAELPAVGAGIVFAFCQFRWGQYIHLQVMSTVWIPLTFLFLDRFLAAEKHARRDGALAVLCLVLTALSSFYLGLFLLVSAVLYAAGRIGLLALQVPTPEAGAATKLARYLRSGPSRRDWLTFSGAAVAGAVLLLPFGVPYLQAAMQLGFVRSLRDVTIGGAALNAFVRPAAGSLLYDRLIPLHRWLASPSLPIEEESFFPGLAVIALSAVGAWVGWCKGARLYLILAGISALLSLGPFLSLGPELHMPVPLPYLALYYAVPGFQSIRVPARMAIFAFLWLGPLVALGLRRLELGWKLLLPIGLAWLLVDNFAAPRPALAMPVGSGIPAVYQWLAKQPAGPIVEFPIAPSRYDESTYPTLAGYEYFSIYHHHPSVLGYSGFAPPLYFELIDRSADFPDPRTLSFLRGEGVRYAIVHNADLTADRARDIAAKAAALPADLQLAGRWGSDDAYEIRPADQVAATPRLFVALPSVAIAAQPYRAILQFAEPSEAAYLLLAPRTLRVEAQWLRSDGSSPGPAGSHELQLPLAYEQGVTNAAIDISAPSEPGSYRLALQSEDALFGFQQAAEVRVQAASEPMQVPIKLQGVSFPSTPLQPGGELFTRLRWSGSPGARFTEFLHLVGSDGRGWSTSDAEPAGQQLPTDRWLTGASLEELRGVKLPPNLPAGEYHVTVGWYGTGTGQTGHWQAPDGRSVTELTLAGIDVPPSGPISLRPLT